MNNKCYVLEYTAGDCEDFVSANICAFSEEQKANDLVALLRDLLIKGQTNQFFDEIEKFNPELAASWNSMYRPYDFLLEDFFNGEASILVKAIPIF